MESGKVNLGNVLVEGLALSLSNLELQSGRLAGTISALRGQVLADLVTVRAQDKLTAKVPAPQGLPPWTSLRLVS